MGGGGGEEDGKGCLRGLYYDVMPKMVDRKNE